LAHCARISSINSARNSYFFSVALPAPFVDLVFSFLGMSVSLLYETAARTRKNLHSPVGKQVRLSAQYLKPNRRRERTAKRVRAKRPRNRTGRCPGIFPLLAALGIWFGVTPALAGEVCRQVSDSDSVRTGRAALERRGIRLGHERTLRIVNETAGRAVSQRNTWLRSMRTGEPIAGTLAGKRVVVAVDGGRLRERVPKRRGPRRKSGHRGYDAPWREPKQLVIYVIDNRTGNVDATFAPVYDSTLGDCDAVFEMLVGYLKALGAHQASRLIVVGDGAPWIWDRADRLAKDVGLANSKLRQVVDWYHAVETLHEIAGIPRWTGTRRDSWIRRAKNALHAGDIDRVAALIDDIAVGRNAKKISSHRDYFVRNTKRMQYASFKHQHIPCGSGAVESTVRRVVNQRLKAPGTFWLERNAEGMLLLRSYLKAGRFDDLIDWSLLSAASWWAPDPQPRDLTRGPLLHADCPDL